MTTPHQTPTIRTLAPITKTIQVRRTRHAGHCWRSKGELISDVLLWTPTYGCAKAGRPARTYIQQLCEDTGCNPEDLPEAMNDREKWRERVRDIRASGGTSCWWWWWCIYIYIYIYILNLYDLVWFCSISSIVGYLMPNPYIYIYIYVCVCVCVCVLNVYDLVWFYGISTTLGYLTPNSVYT